MSASNNLPDRENTYFIDPESGGEMARLLDQDWLVTKGMGGLFSDLTTSEVSRIQRILDIACGPGGWAQERGRAGLLRKREALDVRSVVGAMG